MTTIGCIYNKHTGSWLTFGDRQITEGQRIMPVNSLTKIYQVGTQCLMSGTGSYSDIQQISQKVFKSIQFQKLYADEDLDVGTNEFVKGLSEYLFDLRLDKYFIDISSDFIVVGFDLKEEKVLAYSVSSDGARVPLEKFYSNGSGSSYCLPLLSTLWDTQEKMDDETLAEHIRTSIYQTSKLDLYSSMEVDVFMVKKDGTIKVYEPLEEDEPEQPEDKQEVKK